MTAYRLTDERLLADLDLQARLHRHPSGACHLHLACNDPHLACSIVFRTPPVDDRGLPHMLEHCVLSGSERFPLRDPFFGMLRRSLQTFMNAMTAPASTCFPFASCCRTDFDNLLAVYLDAVFHPLLDDRDIAREAFRLGLDESGRPCFAGVVYNEMLGAAAAAEERLYQACMQRCLPDTCFARHSGGDPAAMPGFEPDMLRSFHRRCYRLGNSLLISYGDLDEAALQDRFLAAAVDGPALPLPAGQHPLPVASRSRIALPWDPAGSEREQCWLAWPWAPPAETGRIGEQLLLGELLEEFLIGNAAAPLRRALESSPDCQSIAGSGFHGYLPGGVFTLCGHGVAETAADAFCAVTEHAIARLREDMPSQEGIDAALHQLALDRQRIRGGSLGLHLAERAQSAWEVGQDILSALDEHDGLQRLATRYGEPEALMAAIDNALTADHRQLLLGVDGDEDVHETARHRAEERWSRLDDRQRAAIVAQEDALAAWQQRQEDCSCLPLLGIAEIPEQRQRPTADTGEDALTYRCRSNGIGHCLLSLGPFSPAEEELPLLPLLAHCIGQLGCGADDHIAWQQRINGSCGQLGAWCEWLPEEGCHLVLETWGLNERAGEFVPMLCACLDGQRFDERDRLAELIAEQLRLGQDELLHHVVDLTEAASLQAFPGNLGRMHRELGLGSLRRLGELRERLDELPALLAGLHRRIVAQAPLRACLIGDRPELLLAGLTSCGLTLQADLPTTRSCARPPESEQSTRCAVAIPSSVACNYLTVPVPGLGHEHCPALRLAARLLGDQILLPRIREQGGAYGAGVRYRFEAGFLSCMSFSDPHLDESFAIMEQGLRQLTETRFDEATLHEARLAAIASFDRPLDPIGECRRHWLDRLRGIDENAHDALRSGLLECRSEDLRDAAQAHLNTAPRHRASMAPAAMLDASGLDWQRQALPHG